MQVHYSQLWKRARNRYRRFKAESFYCRTLPLCQREPVISFTFDDFPRSALYDGGAILKSFGVNGTYYASVGLMGRVEPTGQMFVEEDLEILLRDGHEIGCHTFAHDDAGETGPEIFERSTLENQNAMEQMCPGLKLRSLSYPLSEPKARIKGRVGPKFACCRGGGQTFNSKTADLNCLKSFFLERGRETPEIIFELIEENRRARGWLIFSTHDISGSPTRWGCTPALLQETMRAAVDSGARILPVIEALAFVSSAPQP